jgi:CheY-like chemotaxis protein
VNKFFLLADDDHDDAELFHEALASIDPTIEFRHVDDGRGVFKVLASLRNKRPDIIFLDLNMPEMSGWQCLAKLKNDIYFKDIPVIMYTTSSNVRDREIALELGALGFLTKPANFRLLSKFLSTIIHNLDEDLRKILKEMVVEF